MLNPSIADATLDDQTVKRCRWYATDNGYAGIDVCNLFAYRCTLPTHLPDDLATATGERNIQAIIDLAARVDTIVVGWGATYSTIAARLGDGDMPGTVLDIARNADVDVRCLGTTVGGHPRHPSRLANNQPLIPWPP